MGLHYHKRPTVKRGLVLQTDPNNKMSYISGSTIYDVVNRNNGTLINTLTVVNGFLALNGIDEYVAFGDLSIVDFDRLDAFSVGFVINTTDVGVKAITGKNNSAGSGEGWLIRTTGGKIVFDLKNDSGTNRIQVDSTNTIHNGNNHYCQITYDGSSTAAGVKMWIDGVSETLVTQADGLTGTTLNSIPFNIGARNNGNLPFVGDIGNVHVHNVELTTAEVAQNSDSQKSRFI
jgi:hypothetical protein